MSGDRPDRAGSAEPTESADDAPRLPPFIGDFRIVRRLGAGGMGIVYEAEQQNPKRPVALKVIRGGAYVDEQQVKLFKREAQTLARLKHPSIAAIYEMGRTDDGQHFFAMELVRGETLAEWLKQHPEIDLRVRLSIFRKLCEAVAYAHQRGAIHRDLKPSNVLMLKESPTPSSASSPDAGVPDLKILDFGLARITDHDMTVTTVVSDAGTVRGTLPYMSPEQVLGNPDEIDQRTDVYSLGVILYELLTGKLPCDVQRKSLPEAVRIIIQEPPTPLSKTWSGTRKLDADVGTIAYKALEKEAARRYQSVAALVEDVQRYLADQPILAHRPSAIYQVRKLVSRHRYAAGVVVGAFVLLAGFAIVMTIQANRIAHERDRANTERDRANQEAATTKQVSEFLVGLFQVSDPSEARGNTVTAREILDKGAERIERDLKDQPVTQARLMVVMGDVYTSLGLYDRARPLLERALANEEATFGSDSVELVDTLNALARFANYSARPRDGRLAGEKALGIARSKLSSSDPRLGWAFYHLASNETQLGETSLAKRHLEDARQALAVSIGPESIAVSWCLNDLALITGDYEHDWGASLQLHLEALRLKEKLLPHDHPDLVIARSNIGYTLINVGKLEEAGRLLRQARADSERIYGPEHALTASITESLGELAWRLGDLTEASALLERALRVYRDTMDSTSYAIAQTEHVLACVRRDQGRNAEAAQLFQRALAVRLSGMGSDHAQTQSTRSEYAKLLRQMGRTAEAEALEARGRTSAGVTP